MITSRVTVIGATAAGLEVEAAGPANCARCAAGKGCGGGVFGRLIGGGPRRVLVDDPFQLQPGDAALIGVEGADLLRGVIEMFGWPLLGMFSAGLLAADAGQAWTVLAAVLGMCGGLLVARARLQRLTAGLRPRVLGRVAAADDCQRAVGSVD